MTHRSAGAAVAAMASPHVSRWRAASLCGALLGATLALGGCANGDFGRVSPGLVNDEIHSWIGTTAALGNGAPISSFPLTDDERWPWLQAIGAWMDERVARDESAVVTCSALKRSYRDMLLRGRPQARMVFLAADRQVLARRLAARHGHFFPQQLLGTQLADLELPQPDEHVVTIVPADDPADTVTSIIAVLFGAEQGAGEVAPAGISTPPSASDAADGDHEAQA